MAENDKSKLFLLKSKLRSSNLRAVVPSVFPAEPSSNSNHTHAAAQESRVEDLTSLHTCTDCGRKFNTESFPKHRRVCRKVFKTKRKVYDSSKIRLSAIEEHLPISIPLIQQRKKRELTPPSVDSRTKTNWRFKSAQFRSAIGSMRKENGGSYPSLNETQTAIGRDSNMAVCPHCARSFNHDAAKRHVSICQKLFGAKPGGGRLYKGAGTLSHSTMKKEDHNAQFTHFPGKSLQMRR